MNITYWIVVSVLLLIAFAIIIPPLWKKTEIEDADSDQRNINIAQERAKDLKQQLLAGRLTQQQFDEEYGELELTLGDDLDIAKNASTASSQGKWAVPVIGLCVPLFSVLIYFALGEPDALVKAEIKQPQQVADGQDINTMVMQLAERLKEDPSNAKDWRMLGRSFKYLKQYKLAANSFKKAYDILGDEPVLMLQYADSLVMANGGAFKGKPAELIFKALEKLPNDETGLWLAGMAKAEQKEFAQAIIYWQKLEAILPAGSDSSKQVNSLIATVQQKMTGVEPVEKAAVATAAEAKTAVSINVQVSIADNFKDKISQSDTVFIYAKALTGPPMPLAIVRKKVSDLPLTVTLDDAMAMMPTMKLSNFKAVKVMARISKSGTAMQQKGDFIGELELSKLTENQSVAIVINKEI